MTQPIFSLSRGTSTVTAVGAKASFSDVHQVTDYFRHSPLNIVGALPFDIQDPAALYHPYTLNFSTTPTVFSELASLPVFSITSRDPEPAQHLSHIEFILKQLHQHSTLAKVVVARALNLKSDSPVDPLLLFQHFVANDRGRNGFQVNLSAAGDHYRDYQLIGSSPEVLIKRHGTSVSCHPLAGSIARHPNPEIDHQNSQLLLASKKDHEEHRYVVESIRNALAELCISINAPSIPSLTQTPTMWHLGTPISAQLRDPHTTALEVALALHPTPAVCGTPTADSLALINELETARGFYAGAVGWCNADGDGEWVVAIRCLQLDATGTKLRAWAGGGIVADSDPTIELEETSAKFQTVLRTLNVREPKT